jgi:hypothetical protein
MSDPNIAIQLHEIASALGKVAYAVFMAAVIRAGFNK